MEVHDLMENSSDNELVDLMNLLERSVTAKLDEAVRFSSEPRSWTEGNSPGLKAKVEKRQKG